MCTGHFDGFLVSSKAVLAVARVVGKIFTLHIVDGEDVSGSGWRLAITALGQAAGLATGVESLSVLVPRDARFRLAVHRARQLRVVTFGDRHQVQFHLHFRLIYHHSDKKENYYYHRHYYLLSLLLCHSCVLAVRFIQFMYCTSRLNTLGRRSSSKYMKRNHYFIVKTHGRIVQDLWVLHSNYSEAPKLFLSQRKKLLMQCNASRVAPLSSWRFACVFEVGANGEELDTTRKIVVHLRDELESIKRNKLS